MAFDGFHGLILTEDSELLATIQKLVSSKPSSLGLLEQRTVNDWISETKNQDAFKQINTKYNLLLVDSVSFQQFITQWKEHYANVCKHIPTLLILDMESPIPLEVMCQAGIQDHIWSHQLEPIVFSYAVECAIKRYQRYHKFYAIEEQKDTLLQANKELEQFASILSHDLKSPLGVVYTSLQLIEHRYRNTLKVKELEILRRTLDTVRHMDHMINDLLVVSRHGMQYLDFEKVDVRSLISMACKNIESTIKKANAKIHIDTMPTIYTESIQMIRIFQNLIANAIKFNTTTKVEVHIFAEKDETKQYWKFGVQDNGIGIPKDQAHKLFKMRSRLHSKEEFEGTGIGLAACKKIIKELFHGKIWFDSTVGKGTTFYFTIPFTLAHQDPSKKQSN